MILYLSKHLLRFGYVSLMILATLGNLVADEPPAPAAAADADPLSTGPGTLGNPQTTDNSQAADNSQTPDNSQSPDNSQAPDKSQTPANSQVPNTPLLPQQGINASSPFSSSTSNGQSSQLTAPALYATGANDLSQIATHAALTQAFSQQAAAGFSAEPGMSYLYGPINRIRLGPFDLKVALSMNVVSDDNLKSSGAGVQKISDTSFGVTPAVLLEYGTQEGQKGYASVVYAPTITRFFHQSDEDSDNQNIAFNVQYPFQKLKLDLSQTYSQATGNNQDLNARTTQTSSVTSAGGTYDIDDKLSAVSHVQYVKTSFSGGGGQGDETTSVNSYLSYHLSEKITLGPSLNVGMDKPDNSQKQTYEQPLLQLNYLPTEKISLFAQGGMEFRQYDQGGSKSNPVFSGGVGYTPFDSTSLALSGFQTVHSSSADANQTAVSTGVGFTASQRIVQRFFLGFSFNYEHDEYQADSGTTTVQSTGTTTTTISAPSTANSSQDSLVYRPSFTFAPSAWTSVALYYQYRDNQSDVQGASYHDNQMGIVVSAQF